MADEGPDHVLVERVQRGDKAAFDLLVLKYQHKLVKLISRYVRDHSEVLDVADREGVDLRTAALIKGIRRVAKAKLARGVFP